MTTKERDRILQALADYMHSEGCSCCEDQDEHDTAETQLALLLKVERYDDDSGWNFDKYRVKSPA